jgi:urea carboxylase
LCLVLLLLLLAAIGTVNFTGDMPVILMVDGPSLGGFVCAATIVSTELWKIGQVRQANHMCSLRAPVLAQ